MTTVQEQPRISDADDDIGAASIATREAPALAVRMEQDTQWERQRALCTLLQHPLLTADGPLATEFGLVRRHATWLREWLAHYPGWGLTLHSEVARLRKTPADAGVGNRPARDPKNESAFSRRRYVLLCLLLAVLEQEDRQTALGQLADKLTTTCAADPAIAEAGIIFDLGSIDQRRDLVHVVRLLLDFGVLRRRHGDEEQFLAGKGDVLYNISRPILAAMLCVKRGPSTVDETLLEDRIAAITEEPQPETSDGRTRRLRSRLMRRLLDDPVVYYDELEPAEYEYLNSQRGRLLYQVEQATGMVPEVRREGIAMLDVRGDATDLGLPEEGTDGHLTLLVAQFLADELRENRAIVGRAALREHVAALIEVHKGHWRKDVGMPGAADVLTEQVTERLESLALIRRAAGGIRPLPAIARFSLSNDGQSILDFDRQHELP
jgi:uncharacterized protein (TIGR02678 family)